MLPSIKLVAIDDTPTSLELVSESLQQEGLTIFTATDPEEGLDLIFQEHPQIVLLDLVMPKLSGLQVLERVVEFDPAIDVILMTAHYTTETAVEAIQKGASDYLNKPISIPALRSRVEKLLADVRQRQRALATGQRVAGNLALRRNDRAQPADVGSVRAHPTRGAALSFRSDHRPYGNREGSGGQGTAQSEPRQFRPLRHLQLFGGGGNAI